MAEVISRKDRKGLTQSRKELQDYKIIRMDPFGTRLQNWNGWMNESVNEGKRESRKKYKGKRITNKEYRIKNN